MAVFLSAKVTLELSESLDDPLVLGLPISLGDLVVVILGSTTATLKLSGSLDDTVVLLSVSSSEP